MASLCVFSQVQVVFRRNAEATEQPVEFQLGTVAYRSAAGGSSPCWKSEVSTVDHGQYHIQTAGAEGLSTDET